MRMSDWISDVCSADLADERGGGEQQGRQRCGRADAGAFDQAVGEQADARQQQALADGIGPARTRRARLRHVTHGEEDRRQADRNVDPENRSEEHTSELQSLMRISYAVFCLKKKKQNTHKYNYT